ncbi:MAG: helix-turn-helix domain-containing protein [Pseudomonadota bacterium]
MARPRAFDIDEAIEKAMNLFWRMGYNATNLPELLDAMEISRGSFYKAFGSKKDVFLRALALYERTYVEPGIAVLENADMPGEQAIAAVFEAAKQGQSDGVQASLGANLGAGQEAKRTYGCLLCSAAAETAYHDADIADAINAQLARLIRAFGAALARQTQDDAEPTTHGPRAAERLAQSYVGFRILQRSGLSA